MQPTVYQKPELRDANDNIIQQGAFGKNTALANSTNDGWIDYVANNLEFLYDLAKDEVVPVPSLPASGQTNKTYLLTTTGVSYRWSGTEWVAVSSSEAVGRAESAALLAEQWATKTDGSVDGTEYSAKYYAEQAEASADDAQDTADDMATHLVQIDKNTGGVAKNSKRISNIEKLLQGNLYDYQTDTDTAYTKTVPSGALPYAGIEQIGGKTLVWNQLVNSGTTSVATTSGHKYYTLIDGTASIVTSDGTAISVVDDTADMVCDLTLMFGGGNEPSTISAFTDIFSGAHYPYNAGTLLSAGVTGVKSVGKNLADISIVKAFYPSIVTIVSADEFTFVSSHLMSSTNRFFDNVERRSGQMSISYSVKYNSATTRGVYLRVYYTDGSFDRLYNSTAMNTWQTVSRTSSATKTVDYVVWSYESVDVLATFKVLQIEWNTTATSYSPYKEISTPIPTAIQQLDGYGWSAGIAYNYVDFERKVFVKRVGAVDMGTLNWTRSDDTFGQYFRTTMNAKKDGLAGLICPNYVVYGAGVATITGSTGIAQSTNSPKAVYIVDPAYTDATAFKSAMSGVYLYYELATPVETDISAYLTDDNLIEVGAGGTLTFPNSNGNDYHIPVPSTETYMINLQEAVSNG